MRRGSENQFSFMQERQTVVSMKVIALSQEKGGVGKTTLSTYLAVYLALKGYRVLFLDTEQQKNAASAFGFEPEPGFYDLMERGAKWESILRYVPAQVVGIQNHNLWTVLGNAETRYLNSNDEIQTRITERLLEVDTMFDVCVIDSSPTLSDLHKGIFIASHHILIPTDLEPFSIYDGLPDTNIHTANIRKLAKAAGLETSKVLGIVPNRYRKGTMLHNKFIDLLKESYGELVWDAIPLATAIPESQNRQEFIFTAQPNLNITQALNAFGKRVEREALGVADV